MDLKLECSGYAGIFEEWVRSILQARKSLELLECRNSLYMLYMERVIGELVKQVSPLANQGKLDVDILSNLLCWWSIAEPNLLILKLILKPLTKDSEVSQFESVVSSY